MFKEWWEIRLSSCTEFTAESNSETILKVANHCQSYERLSSGIFFVTHCVVLDIVTCTCMTNCQH